MKITRIVFSFLLAIFAFSVTAREVMAVADPNFPSCANPQGIVQASYGTGLHGVPGLSDRFTGADTVYAIDESNYTQCLCADNGQGIQTNWWKESSLDENQAQTLEANGWTYIPNGADWGLQDSGYFAKSGPFRCGSEGTGGGGGSSTGSVLGLASTGNIVFVYSVFGLGAVLLASGSVLFFSKRK